MKKNLLLVFTLISSFGFSQQVLKRITDTPNYTIVDLYAFRNGTTNGNVVGNSNFDTGTSAVVGAIIIANSLGTMTFGSNSGYPANPTDIVDIPNNENICNGNFEALQNGGAILTDYTSDQDGVTTFNINVYSARSNRDETTDNNSYTDLLHSQIALPKLLNDNLSVPNGTWAICGSRDGVDISNGSTMIPSKNVILRFNGTTWVLQTTYPNGNPVPVLQDVCNSLSISEIENNENKISIYPNPTNNFITIQNRQNSTENFEYKIVDLTGRNVKSGNSKFNEQINIESLTSGNYIIQIQTDSNQFITQKLIKN